MSNDLAVKKSQLTNSIKQMSDYLNGKIDNNTTQLNNIADESIKLSNFPRTSGDLSDSERIQRAINKAYTNGINNIIFEYNVVYTLKKGLDLKDGINLIGNKSTLKRDFDRIIGYAIVQCKGNNIISDFNIDGGSDIIDVDASSDEYIHYSDINITGDNVYIERNIFSNSCGSSITYKDANNVQIYRNIFNSFLDHSIYGRNINKTTSNVQIHDNTFNEKNSKRAVIKNCTNMNDINVYSNQFNTPNSCLFVVESGAKNHNYYGNNGECAEFIECTSTSNKIDNINLFSNNITVSYKICKMYRVPQVDKQFGIEAGKISFKDNDFNLKNTILNSNKVIVINGNVENEGIDTFIFKNNTVKMPNQRPQLFWLFGKIKTIIAEDNNFISEYETTDIYSNSLFNFHLKGIDANFSCDCNGKLIFRNNKLFGKISPLFKDEANTNENSYFNMDLLIDKNIFFSEDSLRLTQTNAQNASTIEKKVFVGKNVNINGQNTTNGNWNSSNFISI